MDKRIDEDIEYFKKKLHRTKNHVLQERYTRQIELLETSKQIQEQRTKKDE